MGNWPSNYKIPGSFSAFGGKVITNNWNEGGFGVTDAILVSGHRTVKALEDLYSIPTQILSSNKSNKNTSTTGWEKDAVGQIWYVQDVNKDKNGIYKGGYYRLVDLSKKSTAQGWEEMKILTNSEYVTLSTSSGGAASTEIVKNLQSKVDELNGDLSNHINDYNTLNEKVTNLSSNVNTHINTSYENLNATVKELKTSYNNLETTVNEIIKKISELTAKYNDVSDKAILKSTVAGNKATYIWTGSLTDFNNIPEEKKTEGTTFIITN